LGGSGASCPWSSDGLSDGDGLLDAPAVSLAEALADAEGPESASSSEPPEQALSTSNPAAASSAGVVLTPSMHRG
jgi:hypothetical protein